LYWRIPLRQSSYAGGTPRGRFLVVGPSTKFYSGLSVYTICLANALSKSNDVSVVLLRKLLPEFLYPGRGNVGRDDCSLSFLPDIAIYDGLDWNSPLSWIQACRFAKRQKPEAVVMQWWTSSVAHMQLFLAIINRITTGAKLVFEMHETIDTLEASILPVRVYARLMAKLLISQADSLVVHSNAVKKQVAQAYHINDSRIAVIPHGPYDVYYKHIDKSMAREYLEIKESFTILCFGMIRKYKGVPYLVEAFNRLPREVALSSRLVIAGEDWGDETSLGSMIDSSPYEQQITYRDGFVPDSMVPQYFCAADVVVLPYLRTAGSGVANIAMAYGRPVVTSNLDTMRECLAGYAGAVFVPVADPQAIAERLMEFHAQHKSGIPLLYGAIGSNWDEITLGYEKMVDHTGSSH
jgi:glycosyltransferase involved in cell wall biosynthesis